MLPHLSLFSSKGSFKSSRNGLRFPSLMLKICDFFQVACPNSYMSLTHIGPINISVVERIHAQIVKPKEKDSSNQQNALGYGGEMLAVMRKSIGWWKKVLLLLLGYLTFKPNLKSYQFKLHWVSIISTLGLMTCTRFDGLDSRVSWIEQFLHIPPPSLHAKE